MVINKSYLDKAVSGFDTALADAWFTGKDLADLGTKNHADLDLLGADDHLIYLLLAGRAGGQDAIGGTGAGEELSLRGTSNADLGLIRCKSSIEFDAVAAGVAYSPYSIRDASVNSYSAAYIGGTFSDQKTIDFSNAVFIYETLRGSPQITSGVSPGFAAFTLFQALPVLKAGTVSGQNPLAALVLNAGPVSLNATSGVRSVTSMAAINWAGSLKTTLSGGQLSCGNWTGLISAPKYSTVSGTTINFGIIRGLWQQNPGVALFAPSAGAEGMTALIAVDMDNITFGGNVTKVALRSALTAATNSYFLLNNGTAQSDFGSSHVHFNDNYGLLMGGTVGGADVLMRWLSSVNAYSIYFSGTGDDLRISMPAADRFLIQGNVQDAEFNINCNRFSLGAQSGAVGNQVGVFVAPTRTTQVAGGWSDFLLTQGGNITVNHAMSQLAAWTINAPSITLGTGSVTDGVGLLIGGNPNQGTNRYGLQVLSNPSGGSGRNLGIYAVGKVQFDNDLLFDTDSSGLSFGAMTNDSSTTVTINTQNVWEEVTSGFVTGEVHNVTFGGAHYLEVTNAGRYLVNLSITLESANNEVVGAAVAVNGTEQTAGHGHSTIPGTNDNTSMSQTVILDLAASDQVSVAVVNHGSATDLDVKHCSLTLVNVGGT